MTKTNARAAWPSGPRAPDPRRTGEHGVAMLEVVLMLPFIWIVLVLMFDFGQAFLERQKTMVALREVALRHSALAADRGSEALESVTQPVIAAAFAPRNMSGSFNFAPDGGTCPGDGEAANDSAFRGALSKVEQFVGRMSSSQSYEVAAAGQPVAGQLLPAPRYAACYAIDSSPWTYAETGGPVNLLKNLVGSAAKFFF